MDLVLFGEFFSLISLIQSRYFRAFFNYDPKKDTLNPCKDASFSFELGDILEVGNSISHLADMQLYRPHSKTFENAAANEREYSMNIPITQKIFPQK